MMDPLQSIEYTPDGSRICPNCGLIMIRIDKLGVWMCNNCGMSKPL